MSHVTAPPAQPAPAPEPAPVPVLPPLWQVSDAAQLLTYINGIGREGLSPTDYDPAGLAMAMRSGAPMAMSQAATDRFNKLASDLALGHVRGEARVDWHVKDNDLDEARGQLGAHRTRLHREESLLLEELGRRLEGPLTCEQLV